MVIGASRRKEGLLLSFQRMMAISGCWKSLNADSVRSSPFRWGSTHSFWISAGTDEYLFAEILLPEWMNLYKTTASELMRSFDIKKSNPDNTDSFVYGSTLAIPSFLKPNHIKPSGPTAAPST